MSNPAVGRLGWLGIAIESTPGVPASPSDYIAYTANTIEGHHTPLADISARGITEKETSSVIGKKWGEGDITINLDPTMSGYFFKQALGTETGPTQIGSTGVYQHTFTVAETSTPVTSTLIFDKVAYREFFAYSTLKDFEIAVSDGIATGKASYMSQFPQTSVSGSNTTTSGTIFTFKDLTVQFGADVTGASVATPTKVKKFDMKLNNNVEAIYRSGNPTPDSFAEKGFEVTGTFDILLEGTGQRDAYYNAAKQGAIFTFNGAVIGSGGQTEQILIRLYKVRINDFKVDTGIDNLFAASASFVGEYSLSNSKTIDVMLTNKKSTTY